MGDCPAPERTKEGAGVVPVEQGSSQSDDACKYVCKNNFLGQKYHWYGRPRLLCQCLLLSFPSKWATINITANPQFL